VNCLVNNLRQIALTQWDINVFHILPLWLEANQGSIQIGGMVEGRSSINFEDATKLKGRR
jgi:hypothetical protein